jgi:hypothetical protein
MHSKDSRPATTSRGPRGEIDGTKRRLMARDIDYAAIAVNKALVEKFGGKTDLAGLEVVAHDRTIEVSDGGRTGHGTRDDLLATIRAAESYGNFWDILTVRGKLKS